MIRTMGSGLGVAAVMVWMGACSAPEDTGSPAKDIPLVEEVSEDTIVPVPDPPDLTEALSPGTVRAGVIDDAAALIPGPKAEGLVGDIKMYNAHAAFVIEGVGRGGGYRYHGGYVVDMAVLDSDGVPTEDRYSEYILTWNLHGFQPQSVDIVSDGSGDGPAHVRISGQTTVFHFLDSFVGFIADAEPPDLKMNFDYTLGPDDRAVSLKITLMNEQDTDMKIKWPLGMAHTGDGGWAYATHAGFDEVGMSGFIPYLGVVSRDVSYGIIRPEPLQPMYAYAGVGIYEEDRYTVPAGGAVELQMWFAVTDRSVVGLEEIWRSVTEEEPPTGSLNGKVILPESTTPGQAWAVVRDDNEDVISISPVADDGSFGVPVKPGTYAVFAYAHDHAPAPQATVTVDDGEAASVEVEIPEAALVKVTVTDPDTGAPEPARVTFIRKGDTPSPHPPEDVALRQKSWSGTISGVAMVIGPETPIILPYGEYEAVATRGFSYERDWRTVTIGPDGPTELNLNVKRVVDTSGWISSDFHIHAYRSADSYVPYDVRVMQAVTEDLDVPILTEHVYAASLDDHAHELEVDHHMVGVAGQEVTTFVYGHFNAFPLLLDPEAPNLGAIWPHDKNPHELFKAMRNQGPGDVLIQVNHPRGSSLSSYFTYVGLDAETSQVVDEENWSLDWDIIEVFNGGCGGGQALEDWIGFTNNGIPKTLGSGSDTHAESDPPGLPRNWIRIDEATVRENHGSLVPVVRNRSLFVSCGPFVRFEAIDGDGQAVAHLGEMAALDDEGELTFWARVEAPTWIHVDQILLWENGEVIAMMPVEPGDDPVVRADTTFTVSPEADAWYALQVLGSGSLYPAAFGGPPHALTNPIEVDADGDGMWTPPNGGSPQAR